MIRSEGANLTFQFGIVGLPRGTMLMLRCDADGNVLVSATPAYETPLPEAARH